MECGPNACAVAGKGCFARQQTWQATAQPERLVGFATWIKTDLDEGGEAGIQVLRVQLGQRHQPLPVVLPPLLCRQRGEGAGGGGVNSQDGRGEAPVVAAQHRGAAQ